MAFSGNRNEIGSNKRTVTPMATTSLVKAETYASARCRVSVSCRLLRHTAGISRAIAGLGGFGGIRCAAYLKSYIYLAISRRFTLFLFRLERFSPVLSKS
jgi:hypothetical protein